MLVRIGLLVAAAECAVLAPGVFYEEERAIPAGVERPIGRPGGHGSGTNTALRIGDWTAQWSQPDAAW